MFLRVDEAYLSFGGINVLSGVSLEVKRGEILSIIGPNGAGKTSLLNYVNGYYIPQNGNIYFKGKQINGSPTHEIAKDGIARTFQNIELFTGLTVLDNLMAARHIHLKPGIFSSAIFFPVEYKKEIQHRKIVEDIIDLLEMEAIRKKIVGILPYGLRKRVELGRALALEPELLLLDEPMAGMNLEEKEDMARFILDVNEERGMTIALIEHDMGVVMDISDRVVVIDTGCKIAEGRPEEIKVNPIVVKAYLGSDIH